MNSIVRKEVVEDPVGTFVNYSSETSKLEEWP